jgi:hypothetical protein
MAFVGAGFIPTRINRNEMHKLAIMGARLPTLFKSAFECGFVSDVQYDQGLPPARGLLDFEHVEGHGLDVNDQFVPPGVDLLTSTGGVQGVKPLLISDVGFFDSQEKPFGVFKENHLLEQVEKEHIDGFGPDCDFALFPSFDFFEICDHDIHGSFGRGYKHLFDGLPPRLKGNVGRGDFI